MEPRIQYAQTEDGVSIAFWTLGDVEAFTVPILGLTDSIHGIQSKFLKHLDILYGLMYR